MSLEAGSGEYLTMVKDKKVVYIDIPRVYCNTLIHRLIFIEDGI